MNTAQQLVSLNDSPEYPYIWEMLYVGVGGTQHETRQGVWVFRDGSMIVESTFGPVEYIGG